MPVFIFSEGGLRKSDSLPQESLRVGGGVDLGFIQERLFPQRSGRIVFSWTSRSTATSAAGSKDPGLFQDQDMVAGPVPDASGRAGRVCLLRLCAPLLSDRALSAFCG